MVKISSMTKVRIVLSVVLWLTGAIILLGGVITNVKAENAWATIAMTGAVVLFGAISSVRKDKISQLKPQYVKKH